MDILKLIKNRRTIRKYHDKLIPKEKIARILEAGKWSSSIHGFQPWKFIVAENKTLIKEISKCLIRKSKGVGVGLKILLNSSANTIANAQTLIVIYNSNAFSKFITKLTNKNLKIAKIAEISAIAASVQNMILTAESLGIVSCWVSITLFCEKEINTICDMKEHELLATLSLGYAAEKGKRAKRKPISEIVNYL